MSINIILPSKNRACQLQLLLYSIKKFAPSLFDKLTILYTTTSELHEKSYDVIKQEVSQWANFPSIEWRRESSFYTDFVDMLKTNDSEYICGLTDDCVFYRHVELSPNELPCLFDNETFCFTFRMGLNTTCQYYLTGQQQAPLEKYRQYKGRFIKWNWKERSDIENYGYPISLDGHIFRTKDIYDYTSKFNVACLREWEGVLAGKAREYINKPYMTSFKQSVLYCVASNCVQDPLLLAGVVYGYNPDSLANAYLDGVRIDLNPFLFECVDFSHIEIPLTFIKKIKNDNKTTS